MSKSPAIAEDLVQDVFLKIWLHRNRLTDVESFNAYLYTTLRNRCYTVLKRMATEPSGSQALEELATIEAEGFENANTEKEYLGLVDKAIDLLPLQQAKVYRLIKIQGLQREEAAKELNLSPQTVKAHLAQASKTIRAYCMTWLEFYIVVALTESFTFFS